MGMEDFADLALQAARKAALLRDDPD